LRILHLYSDWKWTGPSEPILNLCLGLRDLGHDVFFSCQPPREERPDALWPRAEQRGVKPAELISLDESRPDAFWRDARRIAKFAADNDIQIVHVHRTHDHALTGLARLKKHLPFLIVRTNHKAVPLAPHIANRMLFNRFTDGYICLSKRSAEADALAFELAPESVALIEAAIDIEKFDPARVKTNPREELGLRKTDVVAAIVARMQRHRRFDVLLQAVKIAAAKVPNLRLLIVGRGTHAEEVAKRPAVAMGLEKHVVFAGYRRGDYVDLLGSIDFLVFLVPGSDGSCRAVREAMAMGKPVVAANRGMLPEIVEHEKCGLVVDDTPENLGDALVRMARNSKEREKLGASARKNALERFSLPLQASRTAEFYSMCLERRK
jgi:glycosyltransferase involved in cell wall biosynthesis